MIPTSAVVQWCSSGISSVSPGFPTIKVSMGNQLWWLRISSPRKTTLGQSSMGKGTPLLGITFLAIRTEPVSSPMSGTRAFLFGWELEVFSPDYA